MSISEPVAPMSRWRGPAQRTHLKAAAADREAAEFVPFSPHAAEALAHELRHRVAGEVRFGDGDRALYATDASNYRQVPIGVVIPRNVEDVIATMAACREFGAPFLSRGGGTSLAGQGCNTAVLVDYSKYLNHILTIDPERQMAWVEPGVVLDDLRDAAEHYHLTFGPDPSTHDHNTLGGMLGNNSCGVHSVMAGRTADNTRELDVLTYDGLRLRVGPTSEDELKAIIAEGDRRGEIYRQLDQLRRRYADLIRQRYPKIPRRVSGYNLDELLPENGFNVARALVGSEGTCIAILKAGLRLVPSPPKRALVIIGFPDAYAAGDAVPRILEHGPIGLEGIDQELVDFMKLKHLRESELKLLPQGCGWLMVEFGGDTEDDVAAKAEAMVRDALRRHSRSEIRLLHEPAEQKRMWKVRQAGLGATAFVPRHADAWEGWEDSAVPPTRVGDYLRDLKKLFRKYDYDSVVYGHFGDGCIHCRINFGLREESGVAKWRQFLNEAADLVVRYGGSISGEHGDGQSKADLLGKMYGPELLQAFREFKAIWDPEGMMNPGKIASPYPITSNLRLGPEYRPPRPRTHFAFPEDHGNFAHAAARCVGVGECRREKSDAGVMCPSYMATHEEKHSTRGRARMLFEMLHGGPLKDGWKSDAVEDALHLCLACKGCKSDCPVNVDMATYKAEFRSHYYAERLRPRVAYSMGLIHVWARVAATMPSIANFLTQTPGISALVKFAGGIAQQRHMPPFATQTFRQWFSTYRTRNPGGPEVILFPDTFSNYFRPVAAIAAVHVLEAAGWRVKIPDRVLCCGRPLYDWGMLDSAKGLLRGVMGALGDEVARGVPVVGLEPACIATFRDELTGLFPHDDIARRLHKQSYLLGEFLEEHAEALALPHLAKRTALVQMHCHQHAVLDPGAERRLLARLGLDVRVMPSGCCGMAGSFGFEADKYHWSMKIGDRVMLPTIRRAPHEALIIANGFSCREQIEQGTGRRTHHLAEVLAEAMGYPVAAGRNGALAKGNRDLLVAGGALAVGMLLGAALRRRSANGTRMGA